MQLIDDDPIIRSIERTGYPYWMDDGEMDDEDEEDEEE